MSTEKKKPATKSAPAKKKRAPSRQLTISERAEAAALYRAGTVTLEDLAKKFKKTPETMSRLFKRMGVVKGEASAAAAKKVTEAVEAKVLNDTEETLRQISAMRREHVTYSNGLARIAWREISRAVTAGTDIAQLKDLMLTLKVAGEVMGNSRKELYTVLNVEKYERESSLDELPELTVRELTQDEIGQLQSQSIDGDTLDFDEAGGGMMPEDNPEGA